MWMRLSCSLPVKYTFVFKGIETVVVRNLGYGNILVVEVIQKLSEEDQ